MQQALSFAEPLRKLRVTPEQLRASTKPATLAVLRLLQRGPATTHDLMTLEYVDQHENFVSGCLRFGARILELRSVGYWITCEKLSDRSALYTLVGKRETEDAA
jgi:hypothetical protein